VRDVERYCIGTETAHLATDLKGAEFWLEHVLVKREEDAAQRKVTEKQVKEKMGREMTQSPPKKKKKKGCKGKNKKK
jgi:hypothetical protein